MVIIGMFDWLTSQVNKLRINSWVIYEEEDIKVNQIGYNLYFSLLQITLTSFFGLLIGSLFNIEFKETGILWYLLFIVLIVLFGWVRIIQPFVTNKIRIDAVTIKLPYSLEDVKNQFPIEVNINSEVIIFEPDEVWKYKEGNLFCYKTTFSFYLFNKSATNVLKIEDKFANIKLITYNNSNPKMRHTPFGLEIIFKE